MVWYTHLFQNFPQFIVIHIVKGFGIVNKAEMDVFLELSCFFDDPEDVGNLISGSSAFSKSSLNIWKFTVHILLKPGLENQELQPQLCPILSFYYYTFLPFPFLSRKHIEYKETRIITINLLSIVKKNKKIEKLLEVQLTNHHYPLVKFSIKFSILPGMISPQPSQHTTSISWSIHSMDENSSDSPLQTLPNSHTQVSQEPEWGLICIAIVQPLSCVQLFGTPWTAARQASLSFAVSLEFAQIHVL